MVPHPSDTTARVSGTARPVMARALQPSGCGAFLFPLTLLYFLISRISVLAEVENKIKHSHDYKDFTA